MQYVDLDSVIAEALSITPNVDSADWAVARQWAVTALGELGVAEDEIQVCDITAKNLVLIKPKDMRQYIEMALYDSNGTYIPHVFHSGKKRIYPEIIISSSDSQEQIQLQYFYPVDVSEDQRAFYLGTNGGNVSYAKVRYFAYPLDNNGMPMIREDEKFSIMCYIRWAKSAKRNDNQSEIANNWQLWAVQCDRTRAKKKKGSVDQYKTIARQWVRLLPIFNYSRF